MGTGRNAWQAAMLATILVITSNAMPQEAERTDGTAQRVLNPRRTSGILTERLTRSQLKAWQSILEIALAEDGEGSPLYPGLSALYHQVDMSDYEIQIEISTQRSTLRAVGLCRIERHTEGVPKEVVLIQLNLGMIDRAAASELNRRADGLIPFVGLGKRERYAEVLGHELAHVVRLITDPGYRDLYRERQALADSRSDDVQTIGRLTRLIEKPAETAETEIWRELTAGVEPKL
jgi:hypothetical protein